MSKRRADVVALSEVRLAPDPEVVAGIRDLLARAERGEIRGYVFAAAGDAASTASGHVIGDADIAHLYTAISRAQKRLLEIE